MHYYQVLKVLFGYTKIDLEPFLYFKYTTHEMLSTRVKNWDRFQNNVVYWHIALDVHILIYFTYPM